jgi:hypothetical protein
MVDEQEFGGRTSNPEVGRRRVGPAVVVKAQTVEPSCGCCHAVSPGEDDGTRWDNRHGRFESKLDVAGEMFEGVEEDPETEVDRDFEAPGLAGDKTVASDMVK